ncbi:hypothetical protein pb186bvf_007050 [Paramecium bursaria]
MFFNQQKQRVEQQNQQVRYQTLEKKYLEQLKEISYLQNKKKDIRHNSAVIIQDTISKSYDQWNEPQEVSDNNMSIIIINRNILQISQSKVIELETSLHLKKQQFDEFTAKVTLEMNQRINQIQTVVKRTEMEELQEKLDRVMKDNSLFDILLNERENKIQSLQQQMKLSDNLIKDLNEEISQLRRELQNQEQKYNQQAQNLNKNLDEYNCIQKELDDCKETLQVLIKNKFKGIK